MSIYGISYVIHKLFCGLFLAQIWPILYKQLFMKLTKNLFPLSKGGFEG